MPAGASQTILGKRNDTGRGREKTITDAVGAHYHRALPGPALAGLVAALHGKAAATVYDIDLSGDKACLVTDQELHHIGNILGQALDT